MSIALIPPRVSAAFVTGVLATALVVLVAPSRSDAQVWKKVREAAAGKIIDKTVDAGAKKAGIESPATASNASTGRARVAVTAERLDQFLAAVGPVVEQANRISTARAERAKYDEAVKKQSDCMKNAQGGIGGAPTSDALAKASKISEAIGPLNARYSEALQKKDEVLSARLADSMAIMQHRYMVAMYPQLGQCGEPLPGPAAVPTMDATAAWRLASSSGMSRNDFGWLRERIGGWVLDREHAPKQGYSTEELAALEAKADRLMPLAPFFRDGTLVWQAWNDLPNW